MAKKSRDESASSFAVNLDKLDEEWVEQPDLFHRYATAAADARLLLEEVKQELEVVKAELDKDIRDRPNHYGLEKLTENIVSNTITLQPKFTECQKRLNRARYDLDIVQAAVTACDHRKKALEHLVFLHGQQYFASPRARGESADDMRDAAKKKVRSRHTMSREDLEEDE